MHVRFCHSHSYFQHPFLFIDAQSVYSLLFLCQSPPLDYCLVDLFNQMCSVLFAVILNSDLWSQLPYLKSVIILRNPWCVWIMCDSVVWVSVCAFYSFWMSFSWSTKHAIKPMPEIVFHRIENMSKFFGWAEPQAHKPKQIGQTQSATARKSHVLIALWVLLYIDPCGHIINSSG